MSTRSRALPAEQRGPAEQLLDVVLSSSAHLWHNRPGIQRGDDWHHASRGTPRSAIVRPGLFVPAAARLYGQLLAIHRLNADLMAHFASYALLETEWRDLKVACAALMLVQPRSGQPVRGLVGSGPLGSSKVGRIEFLDDDHRAVGEAMLLWYAKGSKRQMTPKAVLRVAELLETRAIARLNREAGFASAAGRKAPLGRWPQAARRWLAAREANPALLDGLVKAGYKETIKSLARKCGYAPSSPAFFEALGWKQKQGARGHRTIGLDGLDLRKRERFDGLDEAAICERIVREQLVFKDVVGRLPREIGLTPAIMVALLPRLGDRDLRILSPTLEALGLLADPDVKARWDAAIRAATDQRALNVAKNLKDRGLREQLETSADHAARSAVAEATRDRDLHVFVLIDVSGSMEGAIERSKDLLTRILAGFPPDRLSIAAFSTMGTVIELKAPTRAGVEHALSKLMAGGGTMHSAAIQALCNAGLRIPEGRALVVIVVGDEQGEPGGNFAAAIRRSPYRPSALGMIVCLPPGSQVERGTTVREAARALQVPFSEVDASQFEDPYQVTRVLQALLEASIPVAPPGRGEPAGRDALTTWLDKVLAVPILTPPN